MKLVLPEWITVNYFKTTRLVINADIPTRNNTSYIVKIAAHDLSCGKLSSMRKDYLIIVLSLLCFRSFSQQLKQVSFSQSFSLSWFTLSTNQNVLIRISDEGKILESGTEEHSLYNANYFAQKLIPYNGRIDYYTQGTDSTLNGKIRSIGTCYFTYYSSKDYPEKVGKIKSAGSLFFDYYRQSDDALIGGKIKNVGSNTIAYY